jgi:plastin-1
MIGIQGSDIVDGTRTLVLGLVWQLMRLSINQTLAKISKNGKGVTDQDIVKWANETVKKGGKSSSMRSFKDPGLSTGVVLLDLLNGVKPGYVDYTLVTQGRDEDEKKANGEHRAEWFGLVRKADEGSAKLAISIARKMGALIFLVPEGEHHV